MTPTSITQYEPYSAVLEEALTTSDLLGEWNDLRSAHSLPEDEGAMDAHSRALDALAATIDAYTERRVAEARLEWQRACIAGRETPPRSVSSSEPNRPGFRIPPNFRNEAA